MLVIIRCAKAKCLNNRHGICTADEIYYDGLCQTYVTSKQACKTSAGICRRVHGKLKSKGGNTLK